MRGATVGAGGRAVNRIDPLVATGRLGLGWATAMPHAAFFHAHCAVDRGADALHLPGWSGDDWARLLAQAQPVVLAAGQVLMKRGDSDRAVYLVADGSLEVTGAAGGGDAMGGLVREPTGAVIGEVSFFDGLPRTATVWATRPTTLLRLDQAAVQAFAAASPARGLELLLALGRVLAFRLRRGEARRAQPAA